MQENQSKYNGRFEINDLIGDAVKNAVARRNQVVDSEDALSALSDEETRSVAGGQLSSVCVYPIKMGIIAYPPDYPTA